MYYLTYESNLNYVNMILKFPTAKRTGFINLKGYRLVYKGVSDNFSYLTLEPSKGDYVPMGVYQLKDSDILNLDMYEGYPKYYHKEYIPVHIEGKEEKALVYIMNLDYDYHIPSNEYVDTCKRGFKCFRFDTTLLDKALIDTKNSIKRDKTKLKK